MHSCIPNIYECDPVFGQRLYRATMEPDLIHDEIGHADYGWFGLLILDGKYYIVSCIKGIFKYTLYMTYKAASKSWDHICDKFEKWFTKEHEYG